MAESVQFHLEHMVPELRDLEERGVFTPAEIQAIVRERTAHEYAIHRRVGKRADYLRYIEYELNLDRLRRKRKARFHLDVAPGASAGAGGGPAAGSTEGGVSISDVAGLRRIHGLYQKMLRKWKGDVDLWVQYLTWCKETSSTRVLGKTFAQAIQLHPTKDLFWIMAAGWEFHDNANILSARVLLQRGLRLNPASHKLWLEYFKLELLWVEKLKERRRILLGERSAKAAEAPPQPNAVEVPELPEEAEASAPAPIALPASPEDALLAYPIPRAIYRNAIRAVPQDVPFRLAFLSLYQQFGPDTQPGQQEVLDSLQQLLAGDARGNVSSEEVRAILCRKDLLGDVENVAFPASLAACLQAFKEAILAQPTARMWDLFLDFLREQADRVTLPALISYLAQTRVSVHANRHAMGQATPQTYLDWCSLLGDTAVTTAADEEGVLEPLQLGTTAFPTALSLWLALADRRASAAEQEATLLQAMQHVQGTDRSLLLIAHLDQQACADQPTLAPAMWSWVSENLVQVTEDALLHLLRWLVRHAPRDGLAKARSLMQRRIALGAGPAFLHGCMALEQAQTHPDLTRLRALHARHVAAHDLAADPVPAIEAWLGYVEFEMDAGRMGEALALYWKVGKLCEGGLRTALEERYQAMLRRREA